jgi:hypothetical protein
MFEEIFFVSCLPFLYECYDSAVCHLWNMTMISGWSYLIVVGFHKDVVKSVRILFSGQFMVRAKMLRCFD